MTNKQIKRLKRSINKRHQINMKLEHKRFQRSKKRNQEERITIMNKDYREVG